MVVGLRCLSMGEETEVGEKGECEEGIHDGGAARADATGNGAEPT